MQIARKNGHVERAAADRRRAVLLTAMAQELESSNPDQSLQRALEAHHLAPDLVPAAAIAGRMLASRGNTPKSAKVVQKTWRKNPHPDLAVAYAYARLGDSPHDRLERIKQLAAMSPFSIESPIAIAYAAIEAKEFKDARAALEPLIDGRLTQRVCTLMARVEGEEHGDQGRVREWLARAVNAPRDPAWTADGVVADRWAAVSPVTGALDAFQWRVPVEDAAKADSALIAEKIEELVKLGAGPEALIAAEKPATTQASGAKAAAPAASENRKTSEAEIVEVKPVNEATRAAAPTKVATPPPPATQTAAPAVPESPATAAAARPATAAAVTAPARAVEPEPANLASSTQRPASVTPIKASPSATGQQSRQHGSSHEAATLSAANRQVSGQGSNQDKDQVMFVSPRAPDDPGTEPVAEKSRRPAMKA